MEDGSVADWSFLAAATRVLVVHGSSYDEVERESRKKPRSRRPDGPRVLHDETDQAGVTEIVSLLADTVPDAPPMDWMEWHQVLFVVMDGGRVLREIGLLSGAAYTRDSEFHDLPLVDPRAVDVWLLSRGVDLPYPPPRS